MISAILVTFILSYILSTRISMPLTLLARTLSTIKEGSGSYPEIPVRTHDEIGFLTSEFNRLFTRLWWNPGKTILCQGKRLTLSDLPPHVANCKNPKQSQGELQSIADVEKTHTQRVLACTTSMEEAAQILGIDPATLWRKRKKYSLD